MDKLCCGYSLGIGVRLIGMLWGILFFYYTFLMVATLTSNYPLWEYLIGPQLYFGINFATFVVMLCQNESRDSRLVVAAVFGCLTFLMTLFQLVMAGTTLYDVCGQQNFCVGENTRFMMVFMQRIEVNWIVWVISNILYLAALILFRTYICSVLIQFWRTHEDKESLFFNSGLRPEEKISLFGQKQDRVDDNNDDDDDERSLDH